MKRLFIMLMIFCIHSLLGACGHDEVDRPTTGSNGQIIVANNDANSLTIYTRTSNGDEPPRRTISGVSTGLSNPLAIAVDPAHNEIFVTNFNNSITIYAETADGDAPPLRTISGSSTLLVRPSGIVVDSSNDEIIVGNYGDGTVTAYARTSNGNIAPLRAISIITDFQGGPTSIALDVENDEIFVGVQRVYLGPPGPKLHDSFVNVYNRTASGDTNPIRTIFIDSGYVADVPGIAVDSVNNELFIINGYRDAINVYSRTAADNAAPLRTISGPSTGLMGASAIAVDTVNNEVYVANDPLVSNSFITVYARGADGDAAPLRTISGASTGLGASSGIALLPMGTSLIRKDDGK